MWRYLRSDVAAATGKQTIRMLFSKTGKWVCLNGFKFFCLFVNKVSMAEMRYTAVYAPFMCIYVVLNIPAVCSNLKFV